MPLPSIFRPSLPSPSAPRVLIFLFSFLVISSMLTPHPIILFFVGLLAAFFCWSTVVSFRRPSILLPCHVNPSNTLTLMCIVSPASLSFSFSPVLCVTIVIDPAIILFSISAYTADQLRSEQVHLITPHGDGARNIARRIRLELSARRIKHEKYAAYTTSLSPSPSSGSRGSIQN